MELFAFVDYHWATLKKISKTWCEKIKYNLPTKENNLKLTNWLQQYYSSAWPQTKLTEFVIIVKIIVFALITTTP